MKIARGLVLVALLAGAACAAGAAVAQEVFPSRPIRIVVPFAPGGITDILARLLGKALSDAVGQPVVIENKPGGGQVIGTELVVRSKPDGYTILLASAPIATNPGLFAKLPYNALTDLAPLISLTAQGFVIAVHEKQPYRTLGELVAAAKAPPGVAYASPGNSTLMHLVGQVMNAEYQTSFQHIPYKGSGPALQDVMGGQVPMIIDPVSTSVGPIRQGRLRALAVTHPTRLRALPDVPTVREMGFAKAEAVAFAGFMVPAGTPGPLVARLNAEFNRALNLPEVRERLVDQMGNTLTGGTPEEFGAMLKAETERWVPLIRRLGLKAD
ncbi:MAG: tripartite tricarboxylate transporter substrate binding protein [Burkholderiales bacterium]|nr:tripartite tricarboxylate transporter substrate binding protein [Burkholderiales bacterium]